MVVKVQILLFAGLREHFNGHGNIMIELDNNTWNSCHDLKTYLLRRLGEICYNESDKEETSYCTSKNHITNTKLQISPESIMLALNEELIYDEGQFNDNITQSAIVNKEWNKITLKQSDKIALIHPVTGG